MKLRYLVLSGLFLVTFLICRGQEQSDFQPLVRYTGKDRVANTDYHDGQMRPAIGVHNYQVVRANRDHPEWADGMGWTYNHAPMLAYWKGYYLCHYLSNPMGEHNPPGVSMMVRSKDGMEWEKPRIIFPVYSTAKPGGKYSDVQYHYMHQRMGFYVAPGGRLLVMGHYGGNNGNSIGRVVREVYEDFSMGPIYFIRLNDHWKDEVKYPIFRESDDQEFIRACESFLSDRVRRIQWWEEDYKATDADTFYMPYEREKAFCFYTISDSLTIGLFKSRMITFTTDRGQSWAKPRREESLTYGGAKIWGQRLDNGRYALVYNPTDASERHPLCVAVSWDGLHFDSLAVVHGEVPVKRYWGIEKRPGPQYVRGIVEGNGDPPGDDLWVVYSVNKEDIWISRVPLPIKSTLKGPVKDDFDLLETGRWVPGWNIYTPKWCPVSIVDGPGSDQKSLLMRDFDPFDYARATRVFGQAPRQSIRFMLFVESNPDQFQIDICDPEGARLIEARIDSEAKFYTSDREKGNRVLEQFPVGKWVEISIDIDSEKEEYSLDVDGESVLNGLKIMAPGNAERIDFRTGDYRLADKVSEYKSGDQAVPGFDETRPGEPVEEAAIFIRNFSTHILH
jgi:hypothetical protein